MSIRTRNKSLSILFDFLKKNKASMVEWQAYLELENTFKKTDMRYERMVNNIEGMENKLNRAIKDLESEH